MKIKIKHPLPQFENEKALLVVSGNSSAEFFICHNGRLEEREQFRIRKPRYLDREGFFMKSGYGKVFGTGSVIKNLKSYLRNRFAKKLSSRMGEIIKTERITSIYLFSPEYMTGIILDEIPSGACGRVRMCIYGNYVGRHPFDLLKKIQEIFEESLGGCVPVEKEAEKILEKSDKARRVLGS